MRMKQYPLCNHIRYFREILGRRPDACAFIRGSRDYPELSGSVAFYRTVYGVLVAADIANLPQTAAESCASRVFAFHIHEGMACAGTPAEPFAEAKGHYNPENCPHPQHAGDMPPLFSNQGYAFMVFLTDRFCLEEVMGRTVIVHAGADDFTSQPSGNPGAMIACGLIE